MPEGDTVLRETIWLETQIGNKVLTNVAKYNGKCPNINLSKLKKCFDKPVVDILCKGKKFFIRFAEDVTLTFHHKMGGFWSTEITDNTFLRMSFRDEDQQVIDIFYNNTRLGDVELLETNKAYKDKINKLADGFIGRFILSKEDWIARCSKYTKKKSVRLALMNQDELCSGLGNYLVAEIMYIAQIHPKAKFGDLSQDNINELYDTCCVVTRGFFEQTIDKRIYGCKVGPLGNPIEKIKMSGRTAWFVPLIQTIGAK